MLKVIVHINRAIAFIISIKASRHKNKYQMRIEQTNIDKLSIKNFKFQVPSLVSSFDSIIVNHVMNNYKQHSGQKRLKVMKDK